MEDAWTLHVVNKQTVDGETECNKKKTKMARTRKPESFVWTDNEVVLLLPLSLNYKASKLSQLLAQYLLQQEHKHVVCHCWCCCYETSQDLEVGGKRSRGGAMASSFWKVCRFAVHMSTGGLRFQIFPTFQKCIFSCCVLRIPVDGRTKRCKMWVFAWKRHWAPGG